MHEVANGLLTAGLVLLVGGLSSAVMGDKVYGSLLAAVLGVVLAIVSLPMFLL